MNWWSVEQWKTNNEFFINSFVFVKLIYKKHIDASVKERPQTLIVPSEEICKGVLCNKHINHHLLFQTDKF